MYHLETPVVNDGHYASKVEAQKRKILSCYSNVADCISTQVPKSLKGESFEKSEKGKALFNKITEPPALKKWPVMDKLLADIDAMVQRAKARRK
jgi:hypothetical protein